ncbi:hypothetical protein B484DRAFT_484752 [Ochromonadaceae sp. CCMP2298]|nr:hypothetical protein B484DRAFT_484752 [Ochromonadaceae sp. CCMP2298]
MKTGSKKRRVGRKDGAKSKIRSSKSKTPKRAPVLNSIAQVDEREVEDEYDPTLYSEVKGCWTRPEDEVLLQALKKFGKKWKQVAGMVGTRSRRRCEGRTRVLFKTLSDAQRTLLLPEKQEEEMEEEEEEMEEEEEEMEEEDKDEETEAEEEEEMEMEGVRATSAPAPASAYVLHTVNAMAAACVRVASAPAPALASAPAPALASAARPRPPNPPTCATHPARVMLPPPLARKPAALPHLYPLIDLTTD